MLRVQYRWALLVGFLSLAQIAGATTTRVFCVWDVMGTSGEVYGVMKDYAIAAKQWGIDETLLKVYTDERVASEDFKAGQCDGVILSGIRARAYNPFIGSIDSIGSVTNHQVAAALTNLLASPKLAGRMSVGDFEVAGVAPVGSVFILVNDRSINTLAKAAGKKVAVLDYDKAQAKLVQRIGAQPVSSEITNFGAKFNNGQVDVIVAPAAAFKPLELYKGLGTRGAVVRFPIAYMTAVMVVRSSVFPAGYGQQSREYIKKRLPESMKMIDTQESNIPEKYWMNVPDTDKIGYIKLMRESRIELTKTGIYNKDMMSLIKRVRCQLDPSSFECALKDE